jgi:hypothetical protein
MVGFFQRLRRSRQHDKQTEVGVNSKPSCGQVDQQTLLKLHKQLGDGPMRFAPFKPERRIEEQILCLTPKERSSFREIKSKWNEKHADQSERQFSDETCLRVARVHAVTGRGFDVKSALKALKYYNEHRLQELTAAKLERELWSQVRTRTNSQASFASGIEVKPKYSLLLFIFTENLSSSQSKNQGWKRSCLHASFAI